MNIFFGYEKQWMGDRMSELEPGDYTSVQPDGQQTIAHIERCDLSGIHTIRLEEDRGDKHQQISITATLPRNLYAHEQPDIRAVRFIHSDGLEAPKQASYPPSPEDTPGSHLSAISVMRAIRRARNAQVLRCPITQ